jgi:preprotein translocase subunit SecE
VAKERALKPKNGFKKWFSETKSELKKVTWPTRKQVVNGTNIVFLMIAVFGTLVWVFDFGLTKLLSFVLDNAVS